MNNQTIKQWVEQLPPFMKYIFGFLSLFLAFFLIEFLCFCLLKPAQAPGLGFGALWSGILAGVLMCLPRKVSRILFCIFYYVILLWSLAQAGYYQVFDKMMWVSTIAYAGEGAAFLGDVLLGFPFLWWIGLILMLGLGVLVLRYFPYPPCKLLWRIPYGVAVGVFVIVLCVLPQRFLLRGDSPLD